MRWRKELRERIERTETEVVEVRAEGLDEPLKIRGQVLRDLATALLPVLVTQGQATLTIGAPVLTTAGTATRTEQFAVSLTGEPSRPADVARPRGVIPGSGRRGHSKVLDAVVSVRFDAPLLAQVRGLAADDGQTVSDWIRNAAYRESSRRQTPAAPAEHRVSGWSCQHMTMTSVPGVLGKVTARCGCDMQPLYAAA